MLQFGLRAHDFGRLPAEALADALAAFKPATIQLALSKALSDAPLHPGSLSPGYARAIREIFARRGIAIAVLGCYINPVHPDSDERNRQLARFEEQLRSAGDFGCPVVGTETGSRNPDCSYHPDTEAPATFDDLCFSIERLVRTAEKTGSIVGVEPVAGQHTISSIEKTQALLNRIDSPALRIIFDPVNLLPSGGLRETQADFFKRAFDAFGSHIVAVHAKDFVMEGGRKIGTLPAGSGSLDYRSLFGLLQAKKPNIDVILENTSPATVEIALNFLGRVMEETA